MPSKPLFDKKMGRLNLTFPPNLIARAKTIARRKHVSLSSYLRRLVLKDSDESAKAA